MSASLLPTEIIYEIFKSLSGKDVSMCRRVCRNWRDAADGLGEAFWKAACERDHEYVHKVHDNSRLSWCELYKSLYSWQKIDFADYKVTDFPATNVQNFQLLPNGVIAVLENLSGNVYSVLTGHSDSIVYYDVETLEELHRETFDFFFHVYEENEKLIVIVDTCSRLCVVPKETKERFFVGRINNMDFKVCWRYSLFDTTVYYQNDLGLICFAKLETEESGQIIVKNYELDEFDEAVIAFSYITDNSVYILSKDQSKRNIYCYKDNDFSLCCVLNKNTPDLLYELSNFHFDWTKPELLLFIMKFVENKTTNITSVCRLGSRILIGTKSGSIYWYPYSEKGVYKLFYAQLNRECVCHKDESICSNLDVFQAASGHKVFALTEENLFILDLQQKYQLKASGENKVSYRIKPKCRHCVLNVVKDLRRQRRSTIFSHKSVTDN